MNRSTLHLLAAAVAALSISAAHAAACPWLGENVPYNAASNDTAEAVTGPALAAESEYVFSEANFPPALASAEDDSATLIASFDPLEAP